jgi:hypothetical protein
MPRETRGGDESLPSLPRAIRLTHPHSFIDENGRHRTWRAGDLITDPAEVALLVERKARHDIVE